MSVLPADESAAVVLGTLCAQSGPRLESLVALLGASRQLGSWVKRELTRSAQTDCGFCVLARIAAAPSGQSSALEIASALGLPVSVVTVILGRLEVSGLVAQAHQGCRCTEFTLVLTAAGRRAFAAACREMTASLDRVVSAFSARELGTLQRVCAQLDGELNRADVSARKSRGRSLANGRTSRRSTRRHRP